MTTLGVLFALLCLFACFFLSSFSSLILKHVYVWCIGRFKTDTLPLSLSLCLCPSLSVCVCVCVYVCVCVCVCVCVPVVFRLFESVAKSCMQKQPQPSSREESSEGTTMTA